MYKQIERIRKEKGRVRAVLYARCSSDEQRKNGYTITDQLEFGRHFCRENDIILVGEYVDEGISATLEIKKRKDLANLIRDAKSDNYDIAVFKCIDRFFRNTEEYYAAQKELRKAGVTWVSIEEPDLDPYDADAAFRIHMVLHDLEEPYKEVFQLRVFGELSFAQIASIFRKTESWARVTYHRARLKIKERME